MKTENKTSKQKTELIKKSQKPELIADWWLPEIETWRRVAEMGEGSQKV